MEGTELASKRSKPKPPKPVPEEEEDEEIDEDFEDDLPIPIFLCKRTPELSCFTLNNEFNVCPLSPCEINEYRFDLHERILMTLLRQGDWQGAYFYFHAVLCKFDVCHWGAGASANPQPQPQAGQPTPQPVLERHDPESSCKIFADKDKLVEMMELLERQRDQTSNAAVRSYNDTQIEYRKLILSALKDIELVALRNRARREVENYRYSQRLALLDKLNENPNNRVFFNAEGDIQHAMELPEKTEVDSETLRRQYFEGRRQRELERKAKQLGGKY